MLRVWHIQNPPSRPMHYSVDTPEEAAQKIDELATLDLTTDLIWANAFGLEEYVDIEWGWCEWHDEENDEDIVGVMDRKLAALAEERGS